MANYQYGSDEPFVPPEGAISAPPAAAPRDAALTKLLKQQHMQKQTEQEALAQLPNAAVYSALLGGAGPSTGIMAVPPGLLPERNEKGERLLGLNPQVLQMLMQHPKYGPALQRLLARQQSEAAYAQAGR